MALLARKVFVGKDLLRERVRLVNAGYVNNFEACTCPLSDAWRALGPSVLAHANFKPTFGGGTAIVTCLACRSFHVEDVPYSAL